jgi:hypothetical protein
MAATRYHGRSLCRDGEGGGGTEESTTDYAV